jgi:hypothetical protein
MITAHPTQTPPDITRDAAIAAAEAGLDFLVRHQITNGNSADQGRFPYVYDTHDGSIKWYSTNWTTGIAIEAMLAGHKLLGKDAYQQAAARAANYLIALQNFSPFTRRVHGVFREVTPQSGMAHVRDSLTAAWALLDYADHTGHAQARSAAYLYGQWFVDVAMEKGYPYCTVRFDDQPWEPLWHGSFHSGSAFFMYRMYMATRQSQYRHAMQQILDHYNRRHLDADGHVTVLVDALMDESLDNKANDHKYSPRGWQVMHQYNDDFGALANLAAWKLDARDDYRDAAERFLRKMLREQRTDGGFGPAEYSCPPAGGAVLLELLAAQRLGLHLASGQQLSDAARYILSMQVRQPGHPNDGAFFGYSEPQYTVDRRTANLRTGAYSIMGLLRYAGAIDDYYYVA